MTTQIKGNDTSTFGGGLDLGSNTITTTGSITGDISVDALSTASGSAPSYSARAWVNFNGTGTVAIRASGNVSSITDNGTGDYTVNFTTAMPDSNFSMAGSSLGYGSEYNDPGSFLLHSKATANVRVKLLYFSASAFQATEYDSSIVDVVVFR